MDFSSGPPIIIKKIKKGGHGHHGGSWKVAYADFVTAMMALFIVLWIVGQSDPVKQAVSEYFIDPSLSPEEIAIRLAQAKLEGAEEAPEPDKKVEKVDVTEPELEDLAKEIKSALEELDWQKELNGQILIEMTDEGLRIELIDLAKSPFFDLGSASPKPRTTQALKAIGQKLKKSKHPLVFEGHTDASPFINDSGTYGNWELSTDRANAARRIVLTAGVAPGRIKAVRGYADTKLRDQKHPTSPSNRRVTILVQHGKGQDPENF